MDVWISGGFALVGALAGVFISSLLTSSSQRKEARRARVEEALRKTSAALAAANFATRVGASNPPDGVTENDIRNLEVKLFIGNLERYYTALHEARHVVAMLDGDGVNVGSSWRTAETFQEDLEALNSRLKQLLAET